MSDNCTTCGQGGDAFTAMDLRSVPSEGDASVCLYCGSVSIFTGVGLRKRAPTAAERDGLAKNPEVSQAILAARRVMMNDG